MTDRRRSCLPLHQSRANSYQQGIPLSEDDQAETYGGSARTRSHLQVQNNRGQDTHATGRGPYTNEQGTNVNGQRTYATVHEAYPASRRICTSERGTDNAVHVNSHLNAEVGSQFRGHDSSTILDADHVGSSYMADIYNIGRDQPPSDNPFPQPQPSLQSPNPLYPSSTANSRHYGSATSSLNWINYAVSEPWASAQQNPYTLSGQALIYNGATNNSPYGQHLSPQIPPFASTPPSRLRNRNMSPDRYSSNNVGPSASPSPAPSSIHYGQEGWDETIDLPTRRPRQHAPPATPPFVHYGQGRSDTLDLLPRQSDHQTSPMNSRTLSQRDPSSHVRSASDIGDPYTRRSRPRDHPFSTNTSVTTTTFISQGSPQAESAPRFQNLPDPLPCDHSGCSHAARGHDRITNMKRHVRERHGEKERVRCPGCPRDFTRRSARNRHQERRGH